MSAIIQLTKGVLNFHEDHIEINDGAKLLRWLYLLQGGIFVFASYYFIRRSLTEGGSNFQWYLGTAMALTAMLILGYAFSQNATKWISYASMARIEIKKNHSGDRLAIIRTRLGQKRCINFNIHRDKIALFAGQAEQRNIPIEVGPEVL